MMPFAYARAESLAEALAAAGEPGTLLLAGGTEVLNWLRLGAVAPARLLDISRLPELAEATPLAGGGLRLGALLRLSEAAQHPAVRRDYPLLSQAILQAASPQIRNLATLGGNLLQKTRCAYFRAEETLPCNKRVPGSGCAARHGLNDRHAIFGWSETCVATQPSDPAVALAALDAVLVLAGARGARRLPLRSFHVLRDEAPQQDSLLLPGEMVVALELPDPAPFSAYVKVRERASYEYATVSAAAVLELGGNVIRRARLALGSVAYKPWRLPQAEAALAGCRVGSPEAAAALRDAFAEARPLEHNAYKVPLARNALLRAIELAAGEAA